MPLTIAVLCTLLGVSISGCSGGGDNQARILVDRLEQLDPEEAFDVREAALARVESLVLDDAELESARDTCVEGHRALLDAEQALEELSRAVGAAEALGPDRELTESERAPLQENWARAQESKATAESTLPRCQVELADLRMKVSR